MSELIEALEQRRLLTGDPAPLALYDPVSYDASVPGDFGQVMRLSTGDINGDGRPDLVCGGDGFYRIALLNADGTFELLPEQKSASWGNVFAATVGDFNQDGSADLALASYFGATQTLNVLAGDGTGQFQLIWSHAMNVSEHLRPADINGDGKLDLVSEGYITPSSAGITALLGNGDGTFEFQTAEPIGQSLSDLKLADVDGDGNQDAITTDWEQNQVVILFGGPDGFEPDPLRLSTPDFTETTTPSLAVADFTGDGLPDIVATEGTFNHLAVFTNTSDRTFSDAASSELFTSAPDHDQEGIYDFQSADLNGDGNADLVWGDSAHQEIGVRLGRGDGTFADQQSWPVQSGLVTQVSVADFDGDGRDDIAAGGFTVWYSSPARLLAQDPSAAPGDVVTVGELDGTAQLDAGDYQAQFEWDDGQITPATIEADNSGNILQINAQIEGVISAMSLRKTTAHATGMLVVSDQLHRTLSAPISVGILSNATGGAAHSRITGKVVKAAVKKGDHRSALSGWRIFIDQDNDGRRDANEPTTVSDAKGVWRFDDLGPGKYVIRAVPPHGWSAASKGSGKQALTIKSGKFNSGVVLTFRRIT